MLERRSSLQAVYDLGPIGVPIDPAPVVVRERSDRTLFQVSGWPDTFAPLCGKLQMLLGCRMPADCRTAVSDAARAIFRVGPERLWIAGPSHDAFWSAIDARSLGNDAIVTDIGDSRSVVRVAGSAASIVLNRGLPVDLDSAVFPRDAFAQSIIQQIPVLVHCIQSDGDAAYDVYVTRDYAVSFWQWLIDAAAPFGCEIRASE
jgi:sarcosine oxidase subunit gamma